MSVAINDWQVDAVLFDLDGTLVDTAPDLATALNVALVQNNQAVLPYETIRPIVSNGANGLIDLAFGSTLSTKEHEKIKSSLITHYQQNIANESVIFDGLDEALLHLEKHQIPWGIVTNKPEYLTLPLLIELELVNRASCIVCGDQVNNPKPHPESILLACKQMNISPHNAIYIGDAERDIRAGRLAGLKTIACAFGYIPDTDDINNWQADKQVDKPADLLKSLLLFT